MRPGRPFNNAAKQPFGVELIVVHVMDGSLFGSTTEVMQQLPPGRAKSWHYGIGWDYANRSKVGLTVPEIFQHVRDSDTAFHAGTVGKSPASSIVRRNQAQFVDANGVIKARGTPNDYSIGIECHGTGSVWHKILTPTLVRLIAWLCEKHSLPANRDTIVGHYEIDAERRANCPGRNCNLLKIVDDVQHMLSLKAIEEEEERKGKGTVT
jgi:N-acetyl-anhydromuramyl-L-alanine amidase AmpD